MELEFLLRYGMLKKKIVIILLFCVCLQYGTRPVTFSQPTVYSSERELEHLLNCFLLSDLNVFLLRRSILVTPRRGPRSVLPVSPSISISEHSFMKRICFFSLLVKILLANKSNVFLGVMC